MTYLTWAFLYGGNGSFVVLHENSTRHYLTQFALERDSNDVIGEVTGNYRNLDKRFRLSREQMDELVSRRWSEKRYAHFYRTWNEIDNKQQLRKIIMMGVNTLRDIHGVPPFQEMTLVLSLEMLSQHVIERLRQENEKMFMELERAREEVLVHKEVSTPRTGLVYVLINPGYGANMLKIGMTTRDAEKRAKELSSSTGVASEFIVAYEAEVSDCYEAEQEIHRRLSKCRVSSNREFFQLPLKDAISVVNEVVNAMDAH